MGYTPSLDSKACIPPSMGFARSPSPSTPNPRFLYLTDAHKEALAHLLYGLEEGEGFIVLSGEVGTGKTTLCRSLLERIESETGNRDSLQSE